MTLLDRFHSWWVFLVRERMGARRPLSMVTEGLTDTDRRLREFAERERIELKRTVMFLEAQSGVFRRIEE